MDIDKSAVPTKFLWLDLEMTGLDVEKDVILEIAVEITDANLQTLATYESRIKQPKDIVLERIQKNVWWQGYPQNRDDFIKNLDGAKPIELAEREIVDLIEEHFGAEPAVLAGNSIHNDRNFIREYMKELELKLHYRMLDVSSFKIVMQAKYAEVFEKDSAHRAFEDVQASIAELQYYLDWFMAQNDAQELEEYVLSFPGAKLTYPFGKDVAVYKVPVGDEEKMFALIPEKSDPLQISLKCDPQLAEVLRETYVSVMPGYHLNKKHWNTVILGDELPWEEVQGFIVLSYNLVVG